MAAPGLTVTPLTALPGPQLARLRALQVTERQAFHGKSFAESLDDWRASPPDLCLGLAVLQGETPVGMVLFKRRATGGTFASLHGLKIALPWQGRGWGHVALELTVAALRDHWPETRRLTLAVDADNAAALAVYRRFGMADSGPRAGRHGPEHHMTRAL